MISISTSYPPSVNHYWLTRRGGGRYISPAGQAYRLEVLSKVRALRNRDIPFKSEVSVAVFLSPPDKRRRDIDNVCKSILDALQNAGVFSDDWQVSTLHLERDDPRRGVECIIVVEA